MYRDKGAHMQVRIKVKIVFPKTQFYNHSMFIMIITPNNLTAIHVFVQNVCYNEFI